MADLLTPQEHQLVNDLGRIAGQFLDIIHEQSGLSGSGDYAEAVYYIHGLQNMVLSQAAARAYPTHYRLMGGEVKREDLVMTASAPTATVVTLHDPAGLGWHDAKGGR